MLFFLYVCHSGFNPLITLHKSYFRNDVEHALNLMQKLPLSNINTITHLCTMASNQGYSML